MNKIGMAEPGDPIEKTIIIFDLLDHLDQENEIERIEIQAFMPGNGWMRFVEVSVDTPIYGGREDGIYPVFKVVLSGHKLQEKLLAEPPPK